MRGSERVGARYSALFGGFGYPISRKTALLAQRASRAASVDLSDCRKEAR